MIRHLLSITSFNQFTDPLSSSPRSREEVMKTFEKNGLARLVEELAVSSQTVALSLDGWTSTNDVSILAVIGHWLSEDFAYKEAVLEFAEIEPEGGMVLDLLQELNIETKLFSITGDNTSNNETLMDTVENGLRDRFSLSDNTTCFQGQASFIRCLARILDLIVEKLLETLESGNRASAEESIQPVDNPLWISGTPGRKSQWRNICRDHNLPTGIKAKRQISRWISSQSEMPQFTDQDWGFLGQVAKYTLYISQSAPQISYAVPIYYDLHDLMHDAASREGEFENLHEDISGARKISGMPLQNQSSSRSKRSYAKNTLRFLRAIPCWDQGRNQLPHL
ncbi:hypothetical protein V8E54_002891 [Elaphomyces granulatus]